MTFAKQHLRLFLAGIAICLVVSALVVSFVALRPHQTLAAGDESSTLQQVVVKITTNSSGAFVFKPKTVTITAGTTVIWKNFTQAVHTATSNTGKFDTGFISAGGAFRIKFTKAGTYGYHCRVHPTMIGTIIVQ